MGPSMSASRNSFTLEQHDNVPLGDSVNSSTSASEKASSTNVEKPEKLEREEWMLTPGERMPFGGLSDEMHTIIYMTFRFFLQLTQIEILKCHQIVNLFEVN